jgi:hypothetical protein
MAVEIKEIVIKAVLTNEEKANSSSSHAQVDQEAMIQECVDQVLKVLNKKNRR